MISSPAKRSQASALSRGVESRSSASSNCSGRTTGIGPVCGCDSAAAARRAGRSAARWDGRRSARGGWVRLRRGGRASGAAARWDGPSPRARRACGRAACRGSRRSRAPGPRRGRPHGAHDRTGGARRTGRSCADPVGAPGGGRLGAPLADAGLLGVVPRAAAGGAVGRLDARLAQDLGERATSRVRVPVRFGHHAPPNESSLRRMTPSRSAHGQIRTHGTSRRRIAVAATTAPAGT